MSTIMGSRVSPRDFVHSHHANEVFVHCHHLAPAHTKLQRRRGEPALLGIGIIALLTQGAPCKAACHLCDKARTGIHPRSKRELGKSFARSALRCPLHTVLSADKRLTGSSTRRLQSSGQTGTTTGCPHNGTTTPGATVGPTDRAHGQLLLCRGH